jgi:plasmid stability protein
MKPSMEGHTMSIMMIRNIDPWLEAQLRKQAAIHGRSMEDEVREILRAALPVEICDSVEMIRSIRRRVDALGGVDIELPPREPMRDPPGFDM